MTSRPADSVRSVLNLGRRDWTSLRITPTQARPLSRKPPTSPHVAHRTYSSYTTSYPSTHISKPPRHGQPLRSTHPRSIKEGELTPHVPKVEYEERRRRLMQSLPEGSVVVCMGGTTRLMTQPTDFFYLTGFAEPDAILVLESRPSTSRGYKMTMFVAPKDPHVAQWAGECSGVEGAMSIFGADEAHPHTAFSTYLPTYLRASHIYASLPPSPSPSAASQPFQPPPPRKRSSLLKLFSPSEASSSSSASSSSILGSMMATDPPHLLLAAALAGEKAQPLEREVQRLRLVKSKTELGIMKRAADISAAAHRRVMRAAQEGMPEGRLVAEFEYECGLGGSERPAYVPVVASGPNCLVIHYVTNDNYLDPGEMVLIDAGCEYAHYASDITRTFPVSGTFSDPQRDLYTAVLNAQKECVRRCRVEDGVSMNELHRASCGLLLQELRQIGFKLNVGDVERTLYPHFLSHHLGSDLHDCPTSDRNAALVEGNVITVEPGIYVPFDNAFPKHFHGMGVRVEDEVAFRKEADGGAWVLSEDAPKEVEEVERACQA